MTATVTYKQAVTMAMADELASDPDVFVIGEDVGAAVTAQQPGTRQPRSQAAM